MPLKKELLIAGPEIRKRIQELAREIAAAQPLDLLIVGILKGAFIFTADLVREISIPLEVDFIRIASYGVGTSSAGEIMMSKDLDNPVEGKNVLLVEDIVDTGQSMVWLTEHLKGRGAASVKICTLIDKRERREHAVKIDYYGFRIDAGFLVGYGLDYAEQYRHLPGIYRLEV